MAGVAESATGVAAGKDSVFAGVVGDFAGLVGVAAGVAGVAAGVAEDVSDASIYGFAGEQQVVVIFKNIFRIFRLSKLFEGSLWASIHSARMSYKRCYVAHKKNTSEHTNNARYY